MQPPGSQALGAIDCPDGLARCNGGVVEASRLAQIPQPCKGTAEQCTCGWMRVGECDQGCVVDDLVLVVERDAAMRQLCALGPDAAAPARLLSAPPAAGCDEDDLFRCAGSAVVSCAEHAVVGVCAKGCVSEGSTIGSEVPVSREAAFALLCTR